MAISYTDGAEIEAHLLELVRGSTELRSDHAISALEYGSFAIRYHLSPERANLLRHFDFKGLDVLELGAGMGAVSRFIAEEAASFTAVEGSPARLKVLQNRLRDLNGWTSTLANIQDFQTNRRFDVVCLIGVLEYSGIYIDQPSPYQWVLRHAASLLKPDGVLLLAIENQQGIKYFAGAPEDHTGNLFDGICGYPPGKTPRTFSRTELKTMIESSTYAFIDEYFPWPDYKLPSVVVHSSLLDAAPIVSGEMASDAVQKGLTEGPRYFPDALAIQEASRTHRHAEFSNSFLFACAKTADSEVLARLKGKMTERREMAWHYAISRRTPVLTTIRETDAGLVSSKEFSTDSPETDLQRLRGHDEPVLLDPRLSSRLELLAFHGKSEAFFAELTSFLRWSLDKWSDGAGMLQPSALDAIVANTVVSPEGEYGQFDLEWQWSEPIRPSWFVLRNVVALRHAWQMNPHPRYETLKAMYEGLCAELGLKPNYEADLDSKSRFHSLIGHDSDRERVRGHFLEILESPRTDLGYARQADLELRMRKESGHLAIEGQRMHDELERLRLENHQLRSELTRKSIRIALAIDRMARKLPFVHSGGRALAGLLRRR
jgi:2-polyprenyl-3-methyl-5-hydroxy-6-metoxy-1,4-benzoquinol methylase